VSAGAELELRDVGKRYPTAAGTVTALEGVSLRIGAGESVAITGPSGCGKSTLLALIAGLDVPSSGTVFLDGAEISSLDEERRAAIRRRDVGLVFQSDDLLPFLTADENVRVQQVLRSGHDEASDGREAMARAGLDDEIDRVPDELSGGQRQRVAVVRALAHQPRILIADEPTGSLDPDTADVVVDLLLEARRESNATLVLVTHEASLAERLGRIVSLRDGRVTDDRTRREP